MAKRGVPTTYDKRIHPRMVSLLTGSGMTDEDMSTVLGISRETFYTWRKKYQEFADAITKAKTETIKPVEEALLKRALGMTIEEDVTEFTTERKLEDGRTIPVKQRKVRRQLPPEPGACMDILKNLAAEKWRDKHDININSPFPDELTDEDKRIHLILAEAVKERIKDIKDIENN